MTCRLTPCVEDGWIGQHTTDVDTFRRDFRAAFGVGPQGASLVRPDGYVAWRSQDMAPALTAAVAAALAQAASSRQTLITDR
jgi:hypothetical protein